MLYNRLLKNQAFSEEIFYEVVLFLVLSEVISYLLASPIKNLAVFVFMF